MVPPVPLNLVLLNSQVNPLVLDNHVDLDCLEILFLLLLQVNPLVLVAQEGLEPH